MKDLLDLDGLFPVSLKSINASAAIAVDRIRAHGREWTATVVSCGTFVHVVIGICSATISVSLGIVVKVLLWVDL